MNAAEIEDLLDAYFFGDVSAQQGARLEELLRADVDARRMFVQAALLEARLCGAAVLTPAGTIAARAIRADPVTSPNQLAPLNQREAKPAHFVVRRLANAFRRFDLAAIAAVAVVAISGYYMLRVGFAPPEKIGPVDPPVGARPSIVEPKPDIGPRTMVGKIKSVDAQATTFVLAIDETQQATFRVPVTENFGREPAHVLLDGKRTTFDDAIRLRREAIVTFLTDQEGEAWVWKVEVTSESR
jgi:hypothetical protein